jgi:hypothetical protein
MTGLLLPFQIDRRLLGALLCLSLAILPLLTSYAQAQTIPVTQQKTWDFGLLPQECTVNHTYYLRNSSDSSITVSRIRPGCSCTSVTQIKEPIPAHDSVPVVVTFKSGHFLGPVDKSTDVYLAGSLHAAFRYRLVADVFPRGESIGPLTLDPPSLSWKTDGNRHTDTIRITNNTDSPLTSELLFRPDDLVDSVVIPGNIPSGETRPVVVYGSVLHPESAVPGSNITVQFTGADAIVVTIPIEF